MERKRLNRFFEKQMITGLIVSDRYLREIRPLLKEELIRGKGVSKIVRWCFDYYDKYQTAPNKHIQDIYEKEATQGQVDPEEVTFISKILGNLSKEYDRAGESNVEYLLEESQKYLKLQSLNLFRADIDKMIEAGDSEGAEKLISKFALPSFSNDEGLIHLDSITPKRVVWAWDSYLPFKKIALFDGDPGKGKSHVQLDLAARISTGASMPDGTPGVTGGAVFMSGEDTPDDTMVPRLIAMGADLTKIVLLKTVPGKDGKPRTPTVEDVEQIANACKKVDAKLVCIDPLMAHLNGKRDSHRDQDIRQALGPLLRMTEELRVATVITRHLNKVESAKAIYRGGGSVGIGAVVRATYLFDKDPEDEKKYVFARIKNSLAPEGRNPSLSFTIEETAKGHNYTRVVWGKAVAYTAADLLSGPKTSSVTPERAEILRLLEAEGKPQSPADVAERLDKPVNNVNRLLRKLDKDGLVIRSGYGWYTIKTSKTSKSEEDVTGEGDNNDNKPLSMKETIRKRAKEIASKRYSHE